MSLKDDKERLKNLWIDKLVCSAHAGSEVGDTIQEAWAYARENKIALEFTFNGTKITVDATRERF